MTLPALTFEGVSVSVGTRRLLDGVDLAIPARGLVGIVGPNGSGKTSLLRTALGLLPCASGRVQINGRALADWPARELARHVTDHYLFFSIFNVLHGLFRNLLEVMEEAVHMALIQSMERRRVPARVLVLVDDQGADAFNQVATLEPLAIQIQLQSEAMLQAQVPATTEHFQGDGHG